jgi:multiple sugar transport system substrate-binding protein
MQKAGLTRHTFSNPRLSRRSVLRNAGIAGMGAVIGSHVQAGAATLVQSTPTVDISGTSLSILCWQHFVPSFDEWFPTFLQEWGDANGVAVTLDQINTADIPAAFSAEVAAQQGHDIIEHIASLAQFEESVIDLRDVWEEATKRHGEPAENCKLNGYNPTTDKYYSFVHGYAPDPANYRKSLWDAIGMTNGPTTFDELLDGGVKIWQEQGVQMGLGMSQEIDSQMAAQTMIWAFGGGIQDADENITINTPETVAAVEFMKNLFEGCMTDEVFGWNAASNNQLLVAGSASYILNSISAFRSAQTNAPDVAKDIFFGTPLEGPAGPDWARAHAHAAFGYQVPTYSKNQATAKEFMLHLTANYAAAVEAGQLYNFPTFPSTAPDLVAEGGLLDNDPFGAEPPDKLNIMRNANDWTVNLGWPGPANALAGETQNTFILGNMMAKAARGELSPADAVAEAEKQLNDIAKQWRDRGLMGGS